MQVFLNQIAAVLEVESIDESDKISGIEQLDSLGILSLIAMLDAKYGINLNTADIIGMNTIGDLWQYVQCTSSKKDRL
jgi:acyl carrier protein